MSTRRRRIAIREYLLITNVKRNSTFTLLAVH